MTKKLLHFAKDLDLPLNVVTEKLAWIGATGSGKTYGAMRLAELMWDTGAQFYVLDPVGVWYGLRLGRDGKSSGIPIPVFGGLHGDVPLEPTAGTLIADVLADRKISAVIDISQFDTDADKARFVAHFSDRLFQRFKRAPAAIHGFHEECQEVVPQNPQPGEQRMLHFLQRQQKLGRNFGMGTSMITQRPQEVSKKVLNQAQTLFVYRLTGSQERKAVEAWVNERGITDNILTGITSMATGDAHLWSPAWLKTFKVVRASRRETFDASATPEVGVQAQARDLAPIDLEKIKTAMAATIEKAKENDPVALREIIRKQQFELSQVKLGKDMMALKPVVKEKLVEKRVEVPALKDAAIKRLESASSKIEQANKSALDSLQAFTSALRAFLTPKPAPFERHGRVFVRTEPPATPRPNIVPPSQKPMPINAHASIGKGEKAILLVCAQYPQGASREQITVLTGYKRSSRDTYLQRLLQAGLVENFGVGLAATQAGIQMLGTDFRPLPTGEELRAYWLDRLSGGEREILRVLMEIYPEAMEREKISELTKYQRSSRDTYLQRLSARQLVLNGNGGMRASDHLFA